MNHYIFSYLVTGMVFAAINDIWIRPNLNPYCVRFIDRFLDSLIFILLWLPLMLYSFYRTIRNINDGK